MADVAVGRKPQFLTTWASVGVFDVPYDVAADFRQYE